MLKDHGWATGDTLLFIRQVRFRTDISTQIPLLDHNTAFLIKNSHDFQRFSVSTFKIETLDTIFTSLTVHSIDGKAR
jgi:hypothetical protein